MEWLCAVVLWPAFRGGSSWELPHSQPPENIASNTYPVLSLLCWWVLVHMQLTLATWLLWAGHGLEKKPALRDMCTCLFVVRLGDKYALIMLCVAEGVLQFMVP